MRNDKRWPMPAVAALLTVLTMLTAACGEEAKEHIAPPIYPKDSASTMTSYGVNTLISDSGVIKYRIVAERWDVNTVKLPSRWEFMKGVFFEQFDEQFHVQAYIQADTAWYYDKLKLWKLRGRVKIRNNNGLLYRSEELYWDGIRHELYSYVFSKVTSPERTLQGTYFRSDERMTKYTVSNSKGSFVPDDKAGDDNSQAQGDSAVQAPVRPAARKHAKTTFTDPPTVD